MNNTTHFNLKKPEYTDFADIQDINDNMDTIDGQLAAPTGDVRDATVSFSDSDLDSNINSFSDFLNKIVSGMKLAKFIRDFKAGMAYVLHKGSLINNGTTSVTGTYALDAAYGKTLKDYYDSLNSSLSNIDWYYLISNESTSTTEQTMTLMLGRKFSDYDILILTSVDQNQGYIRGSIVMPMVLFTERIQAANVFDVNSVGQQHYIDFIYDSDTTVKVKTNVNGYRLSAYGIRF